MVERIEAQGLNEFVGTCRKIEAIEGNWGAQIHMEIEPEDKKIVEGSKTGVFHNFIRKSAKTTEIAVPEGCVLDAYLKEVESVLREAKKIENIMDALNVLKEKKILYRKKVLGRAYQGKEASDYWVPVALK